MGSCPHSGSLWGLSSSPGTSLLPDSEKRRMNSLREVYMGKWSGSPRVPPAQPQPTWWISNQGCPHRTSGKHQEARDSHLPAAGSPESPPSQAIRMCLVSGAANFPDIMNTVKVTDLWVRAPDVKLIIAILHQTSSEERKSSLVGPSNVN